jgi:hypothetical protein
VPEEYRDECCLMPPKETLDGEKSRKNAKIRLKRDAKKNGRKTEVGISANSGRGTANSGGNNKNSNKQ